MQNVDRWLANPLRRLVKGLTTKTTSDEHRKYMKVRKNVMGKTLKNKKKTFPVEKAW